MIYNICENAIKYNKENGKVNIWVGNTLNGKKVIVQDTGIGIPKEHQDRIFTDDVDHLIQDLTDSKTFHMFSYHFNLYSVNGSIKRQAG